MKKALLMLAGFGMSFNLFAAQVDLEYVMKEMRIAFREAANADTVEEMQLAVNKLDQLVVQAKQGKYSPKRDVVYQEGFDKLRLSFDVIDEALAKGDLVLAKQELKKDNSLKKEYHKKAKRLN